MRISQNLGVVALALGMATPVVHALEMIEVPDGRTDLLFSAIEAANSSPGEPTTIVLAETGNYVVDLRNYAETAITSDLTIRGSGSELSGNTGEENFGNLFTVAGGASLEVSDVTFSSFQSTVTNVTDSDSAMFDVAERASLTLNDVRFQEISTAPSAPPLAALVTNRGQLEVSGARAIQIANNGAAIGFHTSGRATVENLFMTDSFRTLQPEVGQEPGVYFFHLGLAQTAIRFSTFFAQSDLGNAPSVIQLSGYGSGIAIQPVASISSSILVNVGCGGDSLGGNIISGAECVGTQSDLLDTAPGPMIVNLANGVEAIPLPGSPAVDRVDASETECPERDANNISRPQDGTGNGVSKCDAGAFEARAGSRLGSGGETGLFYNTEQDGHYVILQRLRSGGLSVFWNGFNLQGEQTWVFGVGTIDGSKVTAQAYLFPQGTLLPGSGADVDLDALEEWGEINIFFESCSSAQFEYSSGLPEFGEGEFALTRLAELAFLGCLD